MCGSVRSRLRYSASRTPWRISAPPSGETPTTFEKAWGAGERRLRLVVHEGSISVPEVDDFLMSLGDNAFR